MRLVIRGATAQTKEKSKLFFYGKELASLGWCAMVFPMQFR